MAKAANPTVKIHLLKVRKKRGVHSKKNSACKTSKKYKKPYNSQGR